MTGNGQGWAAVRTAMQGSGEEAALPPGEPDISPRIDDMIQAMSELHADQHHRAGSVQRAVNAAVGAIGRPAVLLVLTLLVVGWVGLNLALKAAGRAAPDPPPFSYLQDAATLAALYLATVIVITQRHEDEIATHRDQLTLQLAILSDHKSAKIIRLLEDLRRDDPRRSNDTDEEAEALAQPADPKAVLAGIKAAQSALREQG